MEPTKSFVSVVIPVYNEEDDIGELHRRFKNTFAGEDLPDYEMIFVNDGSSDRSRDLILDLISRDPAVKEIELSRNFGHQAAITAGIDHAGGDAVIIMDADLQDPPEMLPAMIAKWREGWDVVYAVRSARKGNIFKNAIYKLFYRILRRISSVDIPLDSGDFSLIDKKVADLLKSMPERNRFMRGLRSWAGFKQTGLSYERPERFSGAAKYTLPKLMRLALDGIFSFSTLPLKIFTFFGISVSALSFLGIGVVLYFKLFTDMAIPGWAATVIPILFLGGIELIGIGLLGEYITRIFDEVKQRPLYVIKEKRGFGDTQAHR
jgi:dolichol-phosphate mannosyltransferase